MTDAVSASETVVLLLGLLPWLAGFALAVAAVLQLARIARALERQGGTAAGAPGREAARDR